MPANLHAMQEKMRGLQAHYRRQLIERLKVLAPLLVCDAHRWPCDGYDLLKTHSHQLAGTGATYGFPEISKTARALYECLQDHPSAEPVFFRPLAQALLAACQAVVQEVEEALPEAAATPQASTLPVVLVVDDDPIMHLTFRKLLQQDAQVYAVTGIADALSFMQARRPELVLIDYSLANGDSGLGLLQAMQEHPSLQDIPTAMVSADDNAETQRQALAYGVRCYLRKPISPADDLAVIRQVLR